MAGWLNCDHVLLYKRQQLNPEEGMRSLALGHTNIAAGGLSCQGSEVVGMVVYDSGGCVLLLKKQG